ncbi:MAG: hypothetical protein DMF61_01200 [Blastocatellia bacterium AA13]|nr:MAG: hypothetical protein DMF61_01200 [Blastocatellia bacterium AA13]
MVIGFDEIRHLIPPYIFNEFGQLTGHYVKYEKILCVQEHGRVQIWLDQESYDSKDPERLICDYDEMDLRRARIN